MAAAPMKKKSIRLRQGDLPKGIIQEIQSYLPDVDAVRSSLLSRSWLHAKSTLPSLRFHQSRFGLPMVFQYYKPEDSRETKELRRRFVKFVDDTLVRYQVSNLIVETFDLSVEIAGSELDFGHVQRWIRSVCRKGLKHLSITALTNHDICTIPFEIFSSEALQTLKIWVQGWGEQLHCPCNLSIKCSSLQVLELRRVYVSDKLIGELISNCPLLEKINLCYCDGLREIRIRELQHLRVFDIKAMDGEIVEIHALSLQSFSFCGNEKHQRPCSFNIDASTTMTRLHLHGVMMEKRFFENLISKFPLLEQLIIHSNSALEGMDITCPSLTKLSISFCENLEDIRVHAPKLVRFDYLGNLSQFDFPGVDADRLKANIGLEGSGEYYDDAYFMLLSEALHISRNLSIQLNIANIYVNETDLDDLRDNYMFSSKNIEELSLWVDDDSCDSMHFSTIMEAFFTVCRPRYINANRLDEEFCNFLLLELMDRRTLSACNSIRNIEVSLMYMADDDDDDDEDGASVMYMDGDEKDETKLLTVPWENLIDGSTTHEEYEYIRFTIDWSS